MKHLGVLKNLIKNDTVLLLKLEFGGVFSVPDPDHEIRGEGEGEGWSYIHTYIHTYMFYAFGVL